MSAPNPNLNPNLRPTRSRYNSPFAAVVTNAATEFPNRMAENEKPKTLLDKWVEPSLAPPRPSFAEAGIERHGVVANMAPLGTRPSIKVMKSAARPETVDTGGRGATVQKATPSSSIPCESITTPEPTPIPPRRPSDSTTLEDQLPALHTPQQQTSARKSVHRPSVVAQSMGQGVFALQQSPIAAVSRPVPLSTAPPVIPLQQVLPNGDYVINIDVTDRVVESAVQEAVDSRRWPTAYALRTLYDDQRGNERMVRLIDAIYNCRADDAQTNEFLNVMKHKKKEGKKDRTGEYYFNGDGSDPPPRQPQFSVANNQVSTYSPTSERSASGARRMSDAQPRRPSFNLSSMSASPHKELDHSQHISKKHKANHFQPANVDMNGDARGAANWWMKSPTQQQAVPQQNGASNSPGRPRSDSNSSSSSLSSVDEHILGGEYTSPGNSMRTPVEPPAAAEGLDGDAHIQAGAQARCTPYGYGNAEISASAETLAGLAHNHTQPITANSTVGPKTYTFPTVTALSAAAALPSSADNHVAAAHHDSNDQDHPSTNTTMSPAALLPPATFTSTPGQPPPQQIVFKAKKDLAKVTGRQLEDNDPATRMKRDARQVTEKNSPAVESFERHQVSVPALKELESASDGADSIAVNGSRRPTVRLLNKKSTRQGLNYDSDSLSSPTLLSFQPDLAPASRSVSRAGTPNTFNRPTRKAKTGTGLRVKTSPVKKKGGTLAGIPRASGERNSPVGNGSSSHNQDDNDDYCSSCGGNGDLVCCDGCTRSFHFKCVDPPMIEGALPDEWFCNVCLTSRLPRRLDDETGTFGHLLANLERKNPSAFHLPKDIREYFENVKTGTEGEYEEAAPPKAKNRAGYDEAPDYFRLKDSKGKNILCHQCHGGPSQPDRAIIPCTYCGLYWHLDCLDTPMAKEPAPGKPFRCPAHVDDLLATIPGTLGPAHRRRKIKGASVIKPSISRGIKNNGDIEIENDPTDSEDELGFYEQREYGHTYKLPELGIKLDFISQVRRKTGGGYAPTRLVARTKSTRHSSGWSQRTLQEQQAALNLASLLIPNPGLGDPKVLIDALLAQASPAVLAMVAQGDAVAISQGMLQRATDRNTLVALKALIESKLAGLPQDTEPEQPAETAKAMEDNEAETEVGGDVEMSL